MSQYTTQQFKEQLDAAYEFPSLYLFKFIVSEIHQQQVKDLFPKQELIIKPSSKGNYVSVTVQTMMPSSESIIEIYKKAYRIEGIIAL